MNDDRHGDDPPRAHPEVERASRSKATAIALVLVLASAGLLYLTIVLQMTEGG